MDIDFGMGHWIGRRMYSRIRQREIRQCNNLLLKNKSDVRNLFRLSRIKRRREGTCNKETGPDALLGVGLRGGRGTGHVKDGERFRKDNSERTFMGFAKWTCRVQGLVKVEIMTDDQ